MASNITCTNTDNRYILEFIGCDLVVVQNSETIFKAKELSLCPWFDEVCDYCYCKHTIPAGGSIEVSGPLNANFLYINIEWPTTAKESQRLAGITLPNFQVQNLIPNGADFTDNGLGDYLTHTYPLQDLFMINSYWQYEEYKLYNYSDVGMIAHVLTATHCDSSADDSSDNSQPTDGSSNPTFDYQG